MFSAKGKVNILSMDNDPLWEFDLVQPLVSTTINIKIIDFDELNILPGDDGRLYLIHSQSDTFKLIDTTIPDLVKQAPIASKYLPNVLFRGQEKKKRYIIDLDKGSIDRLKLGLTPSSLSHHFANRSSSSPSFSNTISFDRIDYVLQSVINNTFIAWNVTYSKINITSAIPYEEFYPRYHKRDYEILMQYSEHYQYIYKYTPRNRKILLMSDQLKGNTSYDESLLSHNKNDSHLPALWIIIFCLVAFSLLLAMGLTMKSKLLTSNNQKTKNALHITSIVQHKKRTVDTGSEDTISQLSTGSRMTENKHKEYKRRHSFSYKDITCCRTMRDRPEKNNFLNKKDNDFYEPFHRESAPEYSLQLNTINSNDHNEYHNGNGNTTQNQILNEESNEEELSPNKIYTMKKIASIIIEKSKSAPPFQIKNITHYCSEHKTTFSHSRQPSDSFQNPKKKYMLTLEEQLELKKLNAKYLQDIKKKSPSVTICRIDECDTNSKKYNLIYKIINNSESSDNKQSEDKEKDNQLLDEMTQSAQFSQMCDTGRFIANFSDIQLIGKGGFGSVFKAMHKIDDCYYAIKVIKFSVGIEEDISKINEVQEIKTMMKVEHKNIVRYITCWFEFEDLNSLNNKKVRSLSMEDVPIAKSLTKKSKGFLANPILNKQSSNNHLSELELELVVKDSDYFVQRSNDYDSIIFKSEDKNKKDKADNDRDRDSSIIFSSSSNSEEQVNDDENDDDYYCPFDQTSNKNSEVIPVDKKKKKIILTYPVYFYMQMEYCEGFPLSYYLEQRTTTLPEGLIVHIFRQIAIAVQHIHSKKIIHRDLKPANIFIHGQFKVKIGDFGLAAEIDQSHREKVGTFLYQSPEQIEGKAYNEKVDIYALGLILLEMCLYFNTESERRITLMNIRKMIYPYPDESLYSFKTEISLARKMTNKNPSSRPSISDVIDSEDMKEMIEKL